MELTAGERLTILMALPSEGDLTTIRIVSQLREDLSFTEEEHAGFGIEVEGGMVRWDGDVDTNRTFELGNMAKLQIVKALQKLNSEGKLTAAHLSVCDKFGIE